jgi:hypothetical protein
MAKCGGCLFETSVFSSNLNEWIASNVVNSKGNFLNDDWSSFRALACHLVWTWRNKEKHDDHFIRPTKQVEVIRQRINSYKFVDRVVQQGIQHHQTIVPTSNRMVSTYDRMGVC